MRSPRARGFDFANAFRTPGAADYTGPFTELNWQSTATPFAPRKAVREAWPKNCRRHLAFQPELDGSTRGRTYPLAARGCVRTTADDRGG